VLARGLSCVSPCSPCCVFDGLVELLDGVTPADRVVSTGGILIGRDAP